MSQRMRQPEVVLALDYGGTKIAAAVCDLAGRQLASAVTGSGAELGAGESFHRGVRLGRDLIAGASPSAQLAAVGVATFGIPFDDRVELAPAISGWGGLAMGTELKSAFPGARIAMATDAKAAAHAEARWGSLAGASPGVYLNLGTGLAAAVVIDGQVLAGQHGAAGEIGYNLRSVADVAVELDRRIMLEEMVSGQALATRANGQHEPGGRRLTTAGIFDAAPADQRLADLITEFTSELAFHLVNLAILVDPARIAVGGGLVRSWPYFGPGLHDALKLGVPYPPELVLARFPHEAPLLGAVALAVDSAAAGPPDDRTAQISSFEGLGL
jgi:glucokinase